MSRIGFCGIALLITALLAGSAGCATSGSKSASRKDGPLQHYQLARLYYEQGRVPSALAELDKSLKLDDSLPQTHFYLGYIHWSAGGWAKARGSFERAIELNPYYTDARMYLADSLEQLHLPDEAIEQLDRALVDTTYPQPEKIYFNRAMILDRMGRSSEALESLRKAVETRPRYYLAHFERARLLEQVDRNVEALRAYGAAEPGLQKNAEFLYRYGAALFRGGQQTEAVERLRRVLDLAPGTETAEKAAKLLEVIG